MSQQVLYLQSKQGEFAVGSREIPSPPAGEVVIKILSTALNPVDWKIQTYGVFIETFPTILGTDIAGEIESVGEGVTQWKKGDKVVTQGFFAVERASFQQYTTIPADLISRIPENINTDEAATIPVTFMAAATGLFADAPIGVGLNPSFSWDVKYKGQTAVVIGGSTSVGQYAIQLLKFLGYSKIIVYASQRHFAYLQTLGATDIVDRGTTPLSSLASAIASDAKITVVYDTLASAESQQAAVDIMPVGTKAVSVGEVKDGVKEAEGKKITSIFGSSFVPGHREFGVHVFANLEKLIKEGWLKPNRYEVIPGGLNGIASGLTRLKENKVSGQKLVVHPHET